MQGPQVLHRHLQDLRFLQLPRTLQQAGQRGITSPLWLRCAPAGRPPKAPSIGEGSLRTGERRAVAAPPAYLLGQSHGHRLPQLGEAAVDAVPPPLLNHFVGNRRPLQNRRGALVGGKVARYGLAKAAAPGPDPDISSVAGPDSAPSSGAGRDTTPGRDAPAEGPLRAVPGAPRLRGRPR